MASSTFKPADKITPVKYRRPKVALAASEADSNADKSVKPTQDIIPSMAEPGGTSDTLGATKESQPAASTGQTILTTAAAGKEADSSQVAFQPASVQERTSSIEHAARNEEPSASEVSGTGVQNKEANTATPPAQPGNAATDDPSPGPEGQKHPAASQPPCKPQQPALVSALDSKLTLESAIERVDGLLRRIALEHDPEGFFQEKVLTSMPGCENYYERIKNPMWFAQIREKLRKQEYKTIHQLQADVELICQNAMIFNQKASKVYKNGQSMLKGAKRQFGVEKSLLREAMLVLHPQGPEAAVKDEAEEQKAQRMPPPPKKPNKPIKPSRSQKLVSKPSSGLVHPPAPAALNFIAPIDIQMNLHEDKELQYSSFSETDDEADYTSHSRTKPLGTIGVSLWGSDAPNESPPGPPGPSAPRPTEWKLRRQTSEWRIRWLEHRLTELNHQHQRYSAKLDAIVAEEKASELPSGQEESAVKADLPKTGDGGVKRRRVRKQRIKAAGLSAPELLRDNSFMAAHAGLKFSHKELKESADAELSEEDINFPARIFAGAEILEQHMHGLRQQLCQGGYETAHRRKPSGSQAPNKGKLRPRPSEKGRATKRARHSDDGAGFVVTGVNVPITLPEKAKTIETPSFREITAEDKNDWVALRERQREFELLKEQQRKGQAITFDGFESSSSEDTSDEKYNKMHSVGEAAEQAACERRPNKKKKKMKMKAGKDKDQEPASDTPSAAVLVKTGSLQGQQSQNQDLTVTVNVKNLPQVSTPAATLGGPVSLASQVSMPRTEESSNTLPNRGSVGARGRARGRGRPAGTTKTAMSAPSKRMAGPGRGHKTRGQKSLLGTPASAPPQTSQPQPAIVGAPVQPTSTQGLVNTAPTAPRQSSDAKQDPVIPPVSIEPGS